jgi:deoxyribodipyrimidine photo-lyase
MSEALGDVPPTRIVVLGDRQARPEGAYVLYWMTAARRTTHSFALERALRWARELRRPLVVLEALRVDHRWASDRFHAFVMDGMRDNAAALEAAGATHYAYIEPRAGEGRGLLEALAARACVVVTDHAPFFFLRRMAAAASARIDVRFEAIDGNGLLPLAAVTQGFTFAHQFRRFVQKNLRPHLVRMPLAEPLRDATLVRGEAPPAEITARWPRTLEFADSFALCSRLPIDHRVPIVEDRGGSRFGRARLDAFVRARLSSYPERSHPDEDAVSGLSFHLHFGHVSAHEVFARVAASTDWTLEKLGTKAHGRREGFWNVSEPADAFLDELVTWREIGLARAAHAGTELVRWEDLPAFARTTLGAHAADRRAYVYDLATLETGGTHDVVWNAAMRQLREEGRIQNYLRMLWGKKILEWSAHPRDALASMIALNDRWSVDGRDPSSYTNIGWVLGLYDRPWAPERPVFGVVRYMSSDAAVKKLRMKAWLAKWGERAQQRSLALE